MLKRAYLVVLLTALLSACSPDSAVLSASQRVQGESTAVDAQVRDRLLPDASASSVLDLHGGDSLTGEGQVDSTSTPDQGQAQLDAEVGQDVWVDSLPEDAKDGSDEVKLDGMAQNGLQDGDVGTSSFEDEPDSNGVEVLPTDTMSDAATPAKDILNLGIGNDVVLFDSNGKDGTVVLPAECSPALPVLELAAPSTATLPGESDACKALGIAACAVKQGYGIQQQLVCFHSDGSKLPAIPFTNPSDFAAELPCSAPQVSIWLSNYFAPCSKLVPVVSLGQSFLTAILPPALQAENACCNIDSWECRIQIGCSIMTVQHSSSAGGIGNKVTTVTALTLAPPSKQAFETVLYPNLWCHGQKVSATGQWSFTSSIEDSAVSLLSTATEYTIGGDVDWPKILESISNATPLCP
jgi:hypothetical protein